MILGMCIQTPRIQKIVVFLIWISKKFSHTDISTTNSKLFPGNYQFEIFLKIFHKIINNNIKGFQYLGFEKGMLGYHSIRKGEITIAASGCTISPPMAYIYI